MSKLFQKDSGHSSPKAQTILTIIVLELFFRHYQKENKNLESKNDDIIFLLCLWTNSNRDAFCYYISFVFQLEQNELNLTKAMHIVTLTHALIEIG